MGGWTTQKGLIKQAPRIEDRTMCIHTLNLWRTAYCRVRWDGYFASAGIPLTTADRVFELLRGQMNEWQVMQAGT